MGIRSIFTASEIKNVIESAYKSVDEKIDVKDPDTGMKLTESLIKYLGIKFYVWRNRLVEVDGSPIPFDQWIKSINKATKKSYGLVEIVDEDTVVSQDIDNATKIGQITFFIQTDKAVNLDFLNEKCRSNFIGNPQKIGNSYGLSLTAYLNLGTLIYQDEPAPTQFGECITAVSGFRFSYMSNAMTNADTKVEMSLYDESNYLEMPITKATYQAIFTSNPVPTSLRPDLTGTLVTAVTSAKTLSFFDINKPLTMAFNDLFWRQGAFKVNGVESKPSDCNFPVFVRITNNGNQYVYKDVIDDMQKVVTNSDFNICSISLKTWGKILPPPPAIGG